MLKETMVDRCSHQGISLERMLVAGEPSASQRVVPDLEMPNFIVSHLI